MLFATRWGITEAWNKGYLPSENLWWLLSQDVPPWIAGVWLGAVLGGRWRPEPTWFDRLGRLLGFAWIAVSVARNASMSLLP